MIYMGNDAEVTNVFHMIDEISKNTAISPKMLVRLKI